MSKFKKIGLVSYLASGLLLVKDFVRPKSPSPEHKTSKRAMEVITFGGLLSSVFMLLRNRFKRLPSKKKLVVIGGLGVLAFMLFFGIIPTIFLVLKLALKLISLIFAVILSIVRRFARVWI